MCHIHITYINPTSLPVVCTLANTYMEHDILSEPLCFKSLSFVSENVALLGAMLLQKVS